MCTTAITTTARFTRFTREIHMASTTDRRQQTANAARAAGGSVTSSGPVRAPGSSLAHPSLAQAQHTKELRLPRRTARRPGDRLRHGVSRRNTSETGRYATPCRRALAGALPPATRQMTAAAANPVTLRSAAARALPWERAAPARH